MSKAKSGDKVRIHYTGKLDDGTQFDSSAGREPLEFDLGGGGVIPGFDSAVDGMAVGESKSVKIESEEAYGPRHEELIQDVPKTELPDDIELSVGLQLQAQSHEIHDCGGHRGSHHVGWKPSPRRADFEFRY